MLSRIGLRVVMAQPSPRRKFFELMQLICVMQYIGGDKMHREAQR